MEKIYKKIILNILKANPKDYAGFLKLKKKYSAEFKLPPVSNATLIKALRQLSKTTLKKFKIKKLKKFLIRRQVRTLSGVTPITVLTKPYKCPGKCLYCPAEPKMPKSYLSNEPAAMRAKLNKFDPAKQVKMRIEALETNGHQVDKIELLILGGCFNYYPRKYQKDFIKKCFDVCNSYNQRGLRTPNSQGGKNQCTDIKGQVLSCYLKTATRKFGFLRTQPAKNLVEAFELNESAKYRIIGITIETRPDLINEKEIKWFRELGITRVQLGVQHLDNKILEKNKRGHTVEQTIKATKLLKLAGFKIDYHIMPDLPYSTPAKDLKMYRELFLNQNFQPDQLKIYPTIVNQYAPLYKLYKKGFYKPYSTYELKNLITKIKLATPYYVRINRLIRDIPKQSIVAGNPITNLRQVIQTELSKKKLICKCIRCREAKQDVVNLKQAKLFTIKYPASGGTEYFISYENKNRTKLYAFLRLRINKDIQNNFIPELKGAAIVRELHTYGQLIPVGFKQKKMVQHTGFGKRLMKIAEDITKKHKLNKIAVIAGVGVRPYYKKLGYRQLGTYMIKSI